MFQIIFNELSAAELSALPKVLQLSLLGEFQVLPEDLDQAAAGGGDKFGRIERGGKKLYRYRASDYRIYFEPCEQGVTVHRILHKNTISDFLFRSKLPHGRRGRPTRQDQGVLEAHRRGRQRPAQRVTPVRKVPLRCGSSLGWWRSTRWRSGWLADKHFLPKARYLPPPTPAVNFGAAGRSSVDPQTGEITTERQFTVSTRL